MTYLAKTKRVTCGPGESAYDVARRQWGDEVTVAQSEREREGLARDGYRPVGSVSVRASQPDYTVMAPWAGDEICPECGGRLLKADCPSEGANLCDDTVSYCRRCDQEWNEDGEAQHGRKEAARENA